MPLVTKRKRRVAISIVGILVLAFGARSLLMPAAAGAINAHEQAPAIKLNDGSGQAVALSDFRGKLVYLDFWASWCAPCQHTLPWMKKLQSRFGNSGLAVVAVNLDESRSDADKALTEINPNYKVLFDPSGTAAAAFNPPSMPTSYLIGADGAILAIHPGFHDGDDRLIEAEISGLLNLQTNHSGR